MKRETLSIHRPDYPCYKTGRVGDQSTRLQPPSSIRRGPLQSLLSSTSHFALQNISLGLNTLREQNFMYKTNRVKFLK